MIIFNLILFVVWQEVFSDHDKIANDTVVHVWRNDFKGYWQQLLNNVSCSLIFKDDLMGNILFIIENPISKDYNAHFILQGYIKRI